MSQMPGGNPPISPDGQYYWDGTAWKPRNQQPAASAAPTAPSPSPFGGGGSPANPYAPPAQPGGQPPQQWGGQTPAGQGQWGGQQPTGQGQNQWGGGQSQFGGNFQSSTPPAPAKSNAITVPQILVGVGGLVIGIVALVIHQILVGVLVLLLAALQLARMRGLIDV